MAHHSPTLTPATTEDDLDELITKLNEMAIPENAEHRNGGVSSRGNEFWSKLTAMQASYCEPLRNIGILIASQPPKKRDTLRNHLEHCTSILALKQGDPVPNNVTDNTLDTITHFIDALIRVYANYVVREYWNRASAAYQQ